MDIVKSRFPSLAKVDTWALEVVEQRDGERLFLQVSGDCAHSAYGIYRVDVEASGDSLLLLARVTNDGEVQADGGFNQTFEVPPQVSTVQYGPYAELIWKRTNQ
jgi:hypothetical protein